jgi:hypothetical protein
LVVILAAAILFTLVMSMILLWGIEKLFEFYYSHIQGVISPASRLNPDYKITQIKKLLNPKVKPDLNTIFYVNGRYKKKSNFTRLDYLALKLNLNPNERLTYRLSLIPIQGQNERIWLRPYYKFQTSSPIPYNKTFVLPEDPLFATKIITSEIKDLEYLIPKLRAEMASDWADSLLLFKQLHQI